VQGFKQLLRVVSVPHLNNALHRHGGYIGFAERALMNDVLNTRAALRQRSSKICQAARAIANHCYEFNKPTINRKSLLDDAAKH
jgi:hypothetical protein